MILFLIVIVFLVSFIASFFGFGGGIFYTPIQLWIGIPFRESASTSLFLIFVTSFSSTIVFKRNNRIDWILAVVLEVPTSMGAVVGGIVSIYFSEKLLGYLLTIILGITAFLLNYKMTKIKTKKNNRINTDNRFYIIRRKYKDEEYELNILLIFPIMFAVGLLMSLLGLSGGIVKIPIMVSLFKIPISIAIGTSAFMVGVTSLSGLIGHTAIGNVNWLNAIILAVPTFLGAQLGSRLSVKTVSAKLKNLYFIFLLVITIITFFKIKFL